MRKKPKYQHGGRPYYDPVLDQSYNVTNNDIANHEYYHHLQNMHGDLQLPQYYPYPIQRPSVVNTDDLKAAYYNRHGIDNNIVGNDLINRFPETQFALGQVQFNRYTDTNNGVYNTQVYPWTSEAQAVTYEKSMKKKYGGYSIEGYRNNSPDRNNPYNIIPTGRISMNNVSHSVLGIDDRGNSQLMHPGEEYQFPGNRVFEIPIKDNNMSKKTMKQGGMYWNGSRWVSAADDSGTYANGVYYQNGGPTYPIGGAAPVFGTGGIASFDITGNGYPTPFAMYPGTGNGGGMLQDLPTHMQMGGVTQDGQYVYPFAMYAGSGQGSGMLQDLPTEMKTGGIHIKKANRGKFTEWANRHHMGVQEAASHVMANKDQYSHGVVAMANFAKNAAGWKHQYGGPMEQYGGMPDYDGDIDQMGNGGHWIQKAVAGMRKDHPCTGSKFGSSSCPPGSKRYNLAKTFRSMHHQYGGNIQMQYGSNPWEAVNPNDAIMEQMYAQRDHTANVIQENPDIYSGKPMLTSNTLTPAGNGTNPNYQVQGQQPQGASHPYANSFSGWGNAILGAGLLAGADARMFNDINQMKQDKYRNTRRGLSENSVGIYNPQGGHGDYTSQGYFRPDQMVPVRAGYFPPAMHSNGYMQMGGYHQGQELDLREHEIENLRRMGYNVEYI